MAYFLPKPPFCVNYRNVRRQYVSQDPPEHPRNCTLGLTDKMHLRAKVVSAQLVRKRAIHGQYFSLFQLSSPLSVSKRDAVTQPLISKQQWAGGDRFAKTNNLISSSAVLISSAQTSLEETGESHNSSAAVIITGLFLHVMGEREETRRDFG